MISYVIPGGERDMLELCTLGTGGTLPLANRALSSLYVRVNGRAALIDCGEGTQVGIRKLGWGFRVIEDVILTHFHGDHCTGIAGLLLSLEKAGKTDTLNIWGPKGLKRIVEGLCVIVPPLSYPVMLHEFPPEGREFEAVGLQIRAFPVDHGGIPCYGYRMTLPRKNAFSPEKAKALGIPVTEWKKLQEGETIRSDGRKIRPEEVSGPPRKGITVVFSTDTRPCETLAKYTMEADLLILEGMYAAEEKMPQALKNHHMLFREAAEIARKAAPGALLLTHFSTSLETPEDYLDGVRTIFEKTWTAKDGETITLRYPAEEEKAWISLC